jgi:hypothetical protein
MTEADGLDKVKTLFQSDILLPAQYFDRIQPKSESIPEERLLLALLMDDIYCFQKYCFASDKKGKALFREAEAWIMNENLTSPFSFSGACDYLEIEADYLRSKIYQWRDKQSISRAAVRICPPIKRVTRLRV